MKLQKVIFYFLLAGLIITGIYGSKNSSLLKTPHAPFGILSLELCYSNTNQAALLYEWTTNHIYDPVYKRDTVLKTKKISALKTAERQTHVDYGFIFFYVGLIVFLIYKNKSAYSSFLTARTAIYLILIAGLCDCIENCYELKSMHFFHVDNPRLVITGLALLVSIPSTIKWALLLFTIVYYYIRVLKPQQAAFLANFNKLAAALTKQLWDFRIVIISLLVLYGVLNLVDQGKDLLIAINSSPWGIIWFMLVIFVLAVLNWFLPKAYDNISAVKNSIFDYNPDPLHVKTYLGRITGSATFLIAATGLLSAMQSYKVSFWFDGIPAAVIFLVSLLFYIELLRHKALDKIYLDKTGAFIESRYWLTFVAGTALTIIFTIVTANQLPSSLAYFSLAFFIWSFLFLLTVNYRGQFKYQLKFAPVLYISASVVFLLFFLFNFRFISSFLINLGRFFSLPVFIAGIVFYTLLASGLLLMGKKYKVQFITLLLLITISISSSTITSFHKVSTVPRATLDNPCRDSLKDYMFRWLKYRHAEIRQQSLSHQQYPVFFVNAYGGGIKAAAWTAMVVGRLNTLTRQDFITDSTDFEHYAFSYSGASGGTIGLSLLAGARIKNAAEPLKDTVFSNEPKLMQVFQHDYLTDDLVGILGRDALMSSFGLHCYADRAKVTEQAWDSYEDKHGISYGIPFASGWRGNKMEVPLFVSNTYDIDGGTKGILAPVKLRQADFPGALMIQNLVPKGQDVLLGTAAFLSARFPYVSPTGKFDEHHHFTDGGTIENSGAETSLQIITVFRGVLDSLSKIDTVYKYVQICILSIPNSIPQLDSIQNVKNLYEVGAPIDGILNTLGGNAFKAEEDNRVAAINNKWPYYVMEPRDTIIDKGMIHPILPLGWQVSDYALDLMYASVKRDTSALDRISNMFKSDFRKVKTKLKTVAIPKKPNPAGPKCPCFCKP